MKHNSKVVSTNQLGVHKKIPELVERYLNSDSKRPVPGHSLAVFEEIKSWRDPNKVLILDSCCGVGESTRNLAQLFPTAQVLGLDKSALRVGKHIHYQTPSLSGKASNQTGNYAVFRADVIDMWHLMAKAGWQPQLHTLFYPNPYPKSSQVQRRWHASPSLKDILLLGGELRVRSNWHIYIQEFVFALECAGQRAVEKQLEPSAPITPFERKYWQSGQSSWQLVCHLDYSTNQ